MKTHRTLLTLLLPALLLVTWAPLSAQDCTVRIKVAPNRIVLAAIRKGNWLTIHVCIPYASVITEDPITVNGVQAEYYRPDDKGDLLVKIRLSDILDTLDAPCATITVVGQCVANEKCPDGGTFTGTDRVRVKN